MSEPNTDPIHLWRAAALLRCELKHGEVENEVQVRMLAAARQRCMGSVVGSVMAG